METQPTRTEQLEKEMQSINGSLIVIEIEIEEGKRTLKYLNKRKKLIFEELEELKKGK